MYQRVLRRILRGATKIQEECFGTVWGRIDVEFMDGWEVPALSARRKGCDRLRLEKEREGVFV